MSDNKKFDQSNNTEKTPGEIIKYKRMNIFKLSQEEFADKFNVPVGTLRNWEQGANIPPTYFLKYIESEEKHNRNIYRTPIEEKRQQSDDTMALSEDRLLLKEFALDKIKDKPNQSEAYEILLNLIGEDGLLENLQTISSLYDDMTLSDVINLMQLVLLQRIDKKLDNMI